MACHAPCPGHTEGDEESGYWTWYHHNISSYCECQPVGGTTISDDYGSYSGMCSACVFVDATFHVPGGSVTLKLLSSSSPCDCGVPASLKTLIGRRPSDSRANFWRNSGVVNGYRFLGWDPNGTTGEGTWGMHNKSMVFHSHWLVLPVHVNESGWKRSRAVWKSTGSGWQEIGNRGGNVPNDIGGGLNYYGDPHNGSVPRLTAGGTLVKHMPTVKSY